MLGSTSLRSSGSYIFTIDIKHINHRKPLKNQRSIAPIHKVGKPYQTSPLFTLVNQPI